MKTLFIAIASFLAFGAARADSLHVFTYDPTLIPKDQCPSDFRDAKTYGSDQPWKITLFAPDAIALARQAGQCKERSDYLISGHEAMIRITHDGEIGLIIPDMKGIFHCDHGACVSLLRDYGAVSYLPQSPLHPHGLFVLAYLTKR
jgi:hypothetical protein